MRSSIFDEYAKIATEKGLVSEEVSEKPKESAKLRRYKKDVYPRAGSDDISTIEALYGVKHDDPIKYEFNIMEAAHPKPVVIAPSYDKLNALVENNIERQNIICNIVMKPTDGNLTGHKYAEKALMLELIKIANDMDNQNIDEIRIIADDCLNSLKKKANWFDSAKEWISSKFDGDEGSDTLNVLMGAGRGSTIGAIAATSALAIASLVAAIPTGGLSMAPLAAAIPTTAAMAGAASMGGFLGLDIGIVLSYFGKTKPIVINIATNSKEVINQIEDIKKAITNSDTAQETNSVEQLHFLTNFQNELNKLIDLNRQYLSLTSVKDQGIEVDKSKVNQATTISVNLGKQINTVKELCAKFNSNVENHIYNTWIHSSKLKEFFVDRFIDNDVQDVQSSIKSLMQAIKQLAAVSKDFNDNLKPQADAAKAQVEKSKEQPEEDAEKDQKPKSEDDDEEGPEEDDIYSTISKMLGHKPGKKELDFFNSLK